MEQFFLATGGLEHQATGDPPNPYGLFGNNAHQIFLRVEQHASGRIV
jgi:hypothetical protein